MKKYLAVAAVAITLLACGNPGSDATEGDISKHNAQANGSTETVKPAAPEKKTIGAGSWEIGTKENIDAGVILPGTYIVTSLEGGVNCYYEIVKNFDQTFESIITNGNIAPGTTSRVVLKKTHAGVTFKGDCLASRKK